MSTLTADDQLKCPVCRGIPPDKILQCVNGHTVCIACYSSLDSCPVCRVPYGAKDIQNTQLEYIMDKMKFECANVKEGCTEILQRRDISKHAKVCQFMKKKIQLCKLIGITACNFTIKCDYFNLQQTIKHLEEEHDCHLYNKFDIILYHIEFETVATPGKELLNGVLNRFWDPKLLKFNNDGDIESYVMLVGFINGESQTASWLGLYLAKDNKNVNDLTLDFCIKSDTTSATPLRWSQAVISLEECAESLKFRPFQIPLAILKKYCRKLDLALQASVRFENETRKVCDDERTAMWTSAIPSRAAPRKRDAYLCYTGATCDLCSRKTYGNSFKCLMCADVDLCQSCVAYNHHAHHLFVLLRSKAQRDILGGLLCDEYGNWRSFFYKVACTEEALSKMQNNCVAVFDGISCNGCKRSPIGGTRYKCLQCDNYDLCKSCVDSGEIHTHHIFAVIMNLHLNDFVKRIEIPGYSFLELLTKSEDDSDLDIDS